MADRVSAMIRLGGTLPRALLGDFLNIVASERLSAEWDGPVFEGDSFPVDGPLELMAHQVAGGSFDELEAFCLAYGLAFSRSCDAYPGQWSGERLVFEGAGDARSYQITDDDRVVVALSEIRALGSMAAIEAHFASAEIVIPPLTFCDEEIRHG